MSLSLPSNALVSAPAQDHPQKHNLHHTWEMYVSCVCHLSFFVCFVLIDFLFSPYQIHHTFRYEVQDVTPFIAQCRCKDLDTIKNALDNCPFFAMLDKRAVRNIQIWRHPDRTWLPLNFPCNLMPDIKVDGFCLIVEPASTPQPKYPARCIKPCNEIFTIWICPSRGSAGVRELNVKRMSLTPAELLLVVDPMKTIRESLADDGRFSSEVLQVRYTHLKSGSTMIPADQFREVLECNGEYDIYTKAPKCL